MRSAFVKRTMKCKLTFGFGVCMYLQQGFEQIFKDGRRVIIVTVVKLTARVKQKVQLILYVGYTKDEVSWVQILTSDSVQFFLEKWTLAQISSYSIAIVSLS